MLKNRIEDVIMPYCDYNRNGCVDLISSKPYVCIVGGANMDIQGFPFSKFIPRDSNPGSVNVSPGGVGRNIGENMARLGAHVKLITVIGKDIYGKKIMDDAGQYGMDMTDSLILEDRPTSTYLSILDESRDMIAAIASMDTFDLLDTGFIKGKKDIIEGSGLCIVDTNIRQDTIEYIVKNCRGTEFFLDTVSTSKAKKVKDVIGCFHTIKPNKIEAEALSGIQIDNEDDLRNASLYFLNKGVKRVFITMGEKGVYYDDGIKHGLIIPPEIKAVSATGAGDAFLAAIAFSHLDGFEVSYAARFAMSASILALSHENTINPEMSYENVKRKMEEMEIC
jgi:Sugar kinases, ribokinase family